MRFRSSTHGSGPTCKPTKVGSFNSCMKSALEVFVSPAYRASRGDRSCPRSGYSRTQGQGAWSCGEFEMPYIHSATTVLSFAGGSGHAPGSSRTRVYSGFLHIVSISRHSLVRILVTNIGYWTAVMDLTESTHSGLPPPAGYFLADTPKKEKICWNRLTVNSAKRAEFSIATSYGLIATLITNHTLSAGQV